MADRGVPGLRRRPGRRGWIVTAGAAVVVVAIAGGGAVFAATRGGDGRYRTAQAQIAEVTQTLALTGRVAAADSASAVFQVSGTVSSVAVKLGQHVSAGQTLAELDTSGLTAAVTRTRSAVTVAQQTLDQDLAAQSGAGTSATSSATAGASTTSSPAGASPRATSSASPTANGASSGGATGTGGAQKAVAAAQKAVVAAQRALLTAYQASSAAQQTSSASFTSAQTACAPFADATIAGDGAGSDGGSQPSPDPSPDPSPTGTPSGAPSTAASATPSPSASGGTSTTDTQALLTACQTAISQTQAAQATTDAAQKKLQQSATTLNRSVTELQKALSASSTSSSASNGSKTAPTTSSGSRATTPTGSSATSAGSQSGTRAATPSTASGGSPTVTADQIITDRAQIDAAEADVRVAAQSLGMATLTTPIGGTVTSIGVAPGDTVSAGSSSAAITVQQAGGYEVSATVPLAQIGDVKVGQSASVTLPSFGTTFGATVASIGVLNVSQNATPSYQVSLAMDTASATVRVGATAQATVDLAGAAKTLTVPTSAVKVSGSTATVIVLQNGTPQTVRVVVGAMGADRTQITSGLKRGQRVVLADLEQQIASSTSPAATGLGSLTSGGGRAGRFITGGGFTSSGFTDGTGA